jgi:hypothetical protein
MKTLEEHNREYRECYEQQERNDLRTWVECPHCKGVELLRFDKYSVLASMPPQMRCYCPNCKKEQTIPW